MADSLTREQRMWRWRVFGVTWLAYAGFYLCRKNFSVCMPLLIEEFGFSKMQLANTLAAYNILYMLGQFVNGMLSDRFGPRLIVGVGLFVSVACNVVMGFGSTLLLFGVMFALNGCAQATGWSGTVKNMSTWFRHRERGVVMGWWCTCYVVGGFVATNFATFAATNKMFLTDLAWRRGFWAPAALLAVVAVVYTLLTRNKPSDAGFADFEEDKEEEHTSEDKLPALMLLKKPAFWVAGSSYFFLKLTRYAFIFWLPTYMTEALGYSVERAGYTSSVYEFVGFSGVVVAGYLSDKAFNARRFPISSIMLFGFAGACFLHPSLAALGFLGNAIGIGLIGMMTYGPDALLSGPAAQDIGGQRGAGTAAGFINGMGSIGQVLSGYLVAYVADHFGWNSLFHIFVCFGILTGILTATKWNYGGHAKKAEA